MGFNLFRVGGRIVGGRVYAPTRASETSLLQAEMRRHITAIAEPIVVCADIRKLGQLDARARTAYQEMLVADNQHVAYSALLADRASPHALQFYRTVQDARNPKRQVFLKADDIEAWLRPHLRADELEALQVYIKTKLATPL